MMVTACETKDDIPQRAWTAVSPSPMLSRRAALRFRTKSACSRCKNSKTKCNEYRPCARCVKGGHEELCISDALSMMEEEVDEITAVPQIYNSQMKDLISSSTSLSNATINELNNKKDYAEVAPIVIAAQDIDGKGSNIDCILPKLSNLTSECKLGNASPFSWQMTTAVASREVGMKNRIEFELTNASKRSRLQDEVSNMALVECYPDIAVAKTRRSSEYQKSAESYLQISRPGRFASVYRDPCSSMQPSSSIAQSSNFLDQNLATVHRRMLLEGFSYSQNILEQLQVLQDSQRLLSMQLAMHSHMLLPNLPCYSNALFSPGIARLDVPTSISAMPLYANPSFLANATLYGRL